MKSILIAFQFLTRLPIQIKEFTPTDLGKSMAWFPLVGLFIGLMLVLMLFVTRLLGLTPEITAGLLVLTLIILTGALHLDGISDTADGFYAGKTKEDILRIMDDSHTGAMGVIAIVTILLLKYAVIISVVNPLKVGIIPILPLMIVPMLSRWGMVAASAILPPARTEGLGQSFLSSIHSKQWIIATLITFGVAIGFLHLNGFIICMAGLGLVVISSFYIKQKIGGLTGDTLGVINEIVEVGGFFSVYLLYRI